MNIEINTPNAINNRNIINIRDSVTRFFNLFFYLLRSFQRFVRFFTSGFFRSFQRFRLRATF
jgi:hypothetical protein